MSGALRLRALRVQGVGIFGEAQVNIGPLSDGINVIAGPNESGKSTLVRALKAALFQRYSFKGRDIQALRPYGNSKVAPQVTVELSVDDTLYRLEKRFLQSPTARLFCGDDPEPLRDEAADDRIVELMGARRGGKKGSDLDDMGVWGLLWVHQDELAVQDPAKALGDNVRGTLVQAIEQHVGAVVGGAEGVRLRDAIEDEYQLFFTPKHDRSRGALAELEEQVKALDIEVTTLEQRARETETLAQDITEAEEHLTHLSAEESLRVRELLDAERLAEELAALEGSALDAQHRSDAAVERAEALRQREKRREAQRQELTRCVDSKSATERASAAERSADTHEALCLAEAEHRAAELSRAFEEARKTYADAAARCEVFQAREDLRRDQGTLAEALCLQATALARREDLQGLPDAAALRAIEEAEIQCQHQDSRIRQSATQLIVERKGLSPMVHCVTRRIRIEIPELGALELEPPRSGFTQARLAFRRAREDLGRALPGLRVATVARAREIAEAREGIEQQLAARQKSLSTLCPKGLESLEKELIPARRDAETRERQLVEARKEESSAEVLAQELGSLPVDLDAARTLEALAQRVHTLTTELSRVGVRLCIETLGSARVQLGAEDTVITPGVRLERALRGPITVIIDDKVSLTVDPGAAVNAELACALEATQRQLDERLQTLEVSSVDEAYALAMKRTRFKAALDGARARLRSLCPEGVAVFESDCARRRQRLSELETTLREAQGIALESEDLRAKASELPVTLAEFRRLDALDLEALRAEQALRSCVGRVLSAEGALAELWSPTTDLVEDLEAELLGARIKLTLREAETDLELPVLQGELSRRLTAAGAETLSSARDRHVRFSTLSAELDSTERELSRRAPEGVVALRERSARRAARLAGAAGGAPEDASEELLVALRAQAQQGQATAEAAEREAGLAVGRARLRREEARRRLDHGAMQHARALALHESAEQLLAAERRALDDDDLRAALQTAETERAAAAGALSLATRRLAEATPELRRAEISRTRGALERHQRDRIKASMELEKQRGTLEAMAREGRFDTLQERREARDQTRAECARMTAQGRAIKLLRELAQAAYTEAQKKLLSPVYEEVRRLLPAVRPDTTLQMDPGSLALRQVTTRGYDESFDDLSGGAREQLAVIVRIALARVFAQQRRALPMILDDILGWTDDARFRQMIGVLEHAARDLQVIVLTCHPTRFSRFSNASVFTLETPKSRPAAPP